MEQVCSVCKSNSVEVPKRQMSTKEPSVVVMINESFNFKVTADKINHKNICKLCTSDVQAAYRFKRNYEQNIKLKEINDDAFIDSLVEENWDIVRNFVKEEKENISDDESAKEREPQSGTNTNSTGKNTDDEAPTEPKKNVRKSKFFVTKYA